MPSARQYRTTLIVIVTTVIAAIVFSACSKRITPSRSASSNGSLAISSVASTLPASTIATSRPSTASASPTLSPTSATLSATSPSGTSCTSSGLQLALVDVAGAGGSSYSTYRVTNTATVRCALAQPTVSFVNAAGTTIKQAELSGAPGTLSLKPGDSATFTVSDDSCPSPVAATQLVATLADSSNVLALAGKYQVCAPAITPIAAG